MYSSEDLERFYFQYQTEALPHRESLQSFCVKNKVPYNIFQKWFKDTRKKVVEVPIDGAPVLTHEKKDKTSVQPQPILKNSENSVCIWIDSSCGREVLTGFLGDAELKSIMSDGYNAYVFIGDELKSARFKDTVHQVCMSHAKHKFVKASNQGGEPVAERFSTILKEFFMGERKCDDAGFTSEETLRERQSLETKELLIDNNLAERTIRKLTTQRNNSLHYGSDAGAEMAATYHSVIGTVKLHGSSIWNFIGTFFKNIFNGCRDYVNMVPDKITLATSQC
ncbi:IS66 family transposase [Phocaeicola dorei]|uniref:IS66 family transposase n=1 Tax=Phocaeicola dorei TaxID=357276 RepID=UPI0035626DD5